jgi:hypothetical protein
MTRRSARPAPTAVALQTASLLLVAGCVFAILISDIVRTRLGTTSAETVPSLSARGVHDIANAALALEPR